MFDSQVITALAQALRPHREVLLDEPARLKALVRDACGAWKRECNLLIDAVDAGVPVGLVRDSGSLGMRQDRLRQRLEDTYPVTAEVADWAVSAWTQALGVGEPEVVEDVVPAAVSVPPVVDRAQEVVVRPEAPPVSVRGGNWRGLVWVIAAIVVLIVAARVGYVLTRPSQAQQDLAAVPGVYEARIDFEEATYHGSGDEASAQKKLESEDSGTLTMYKDNTFRLDDPAKGRDTAVLGIWTFRAFDYHLALQPQKAIDVRSGKVAEDLSTQKPIELYQAFVNVLYATGSLADQFKRDSESSGFQGARLRFMRKFPQD